MTHPAPADRMIGTAHGLRLHVRDWRPAAAVGEPVICLPGLARPLEDFTELAERLSSAEGGSRRVVAISARGRGQSDRDPDASRYDVKVEAADVLSVMDALSIPHGAVVGTSRGGIQAMALAAMRPGAVRALVLNDVGPVIDLRGLIRIRGYLGSTGAPANWTEATNLSRQMFADRFPALGDADFERLARRTWRESGDALEPNYDRALVNAFAGLDLERPVPPLWALFDAVAGAPTMVIRGERSDILSAASVAEMARRRPGLRIVEVPGQGHAPLLADRPTQDAIAAFLGAASV
jgi:pimeloyl-ACP methyl ester carboxylesterase